MVHATAQGFEAAAREYDRGRPGYPVRAVEEVLGWLKATPFSRVADLGAGTGKLARLLSVRGLKVLAVEPSSAMIQRAGASPTLIPVRAVAESLPFREASLDGATAATAFHWFDGPKVVAELHRVLKKGARIVLLWNQRDDSTAWVAELSRIVNRLEAGAPRFRYGTWREPFETSVNRFRRVGEVSMTHVHELTLEGVLDRVASVSFVAASPREAREAVLSEVRSLLLSHPETKDQGVIRFPYHLDGFAWERR